jgi:uncharacterized protein
MKLEGLALRLSATDLAGHLGCAHLTELDRLAALAVLRPPVWHDPMLEVLRERGIVHEAAYLAYLRDERKLEVARLDGEGSPERAAEEAVAAMRAGVPVIAQATLRDGRWHGRADVLLRLEAPSRLGAWSYEVADTKLAAETRAGTVLQLCLYSDLLERVQGEPPEWMYVVSPGRYAEPETFRTHDFLAYYRWVRERLARAVDSAADEPALYPEPVPHCDVCRWWKRCDGRRRADDHLSLVAGITRLQRGEFAARGIDTLARLAHARLPLEPRPRRGSARGYERAHAQARIQLASRGKQVPLFERLEPIEPGKGLARLPAPSPGDVFLDLEGDPFVPDGGREYLFGWVVIDGAGRPRYRCRWALDAPSERTAFEAFVDEVVARWEQHPDLHVYHFAPYEPAALRRLMGRHATREEQIDRLLRGERFVDLHAVVRQGLRVGVEHYTLKDLEPVHSFRRALDLREAGTHLRAVQRALELGHADAIPAETRAAVETYNREDCVSTWSLREWLEARRAELVAGGTPVPRPEPGSGEPPEKVDERAQRIAALFERLTAGVPEDPAARSDADRAHWLLAHLLDWHRREDRSTWWEYFRLRETPEEELIDEKAALAGLEFVGTQGADAPSPVHRYRYPAQDHDVRAGHVLHTADEGELGAVIAIDPVLCTVDIKKRRAVRDVHPRAAFVFDYVNPGPLPGALEDLARHVAEHGLDEPGPYRAALDLLLRHPPRVGQRPGESLRREGEPLVEAGRRLALSLDGSVLPVQGPPGAGKTYIGARMISSLVAAGKKVGVTAVSHKVIRKLLEDSLQAAREDGVDLSCVHKVGSRNDEPPAAIGEVDDNPALLRAVRQGSVCGGTVWAWARPEFEGALDVLVVDEAGQLSLADALAAARAAKSVILLGDPQQLEQPIQGSHPEGADRSALEHLLEGKETILDDHGLFLTETWRLHPAICDFTSEIFYERRLSSRAGLERQAIVGGPFPGAGLWYVPVEHEGNQNGSPQEVERIGEILDRLLERGVSWIDAKGEQRPLTFDDVLIVAPYNAQVAAIGRRLPHAKVGTVDKFQGQEAPIVIYSMATSSPDDAPRGMEFLYSLNRLNVATSRARCACILVASPRLFEPECRTPQQIRLANALCRYREMAREA